MPPPFGLLRGNVQYIGTTLGSCHILSWIVFVRRTSTVLSYFFQIQVNKKIKDLRTFELSSKEFLYHVKWIGKTKKKEKKKTKTDEPVRFS